MDFTFSSYKKFLNALISKGYSFLTFEEYLTQRESNNKPFVILRHDIDARKNNAAIFAEIQHKLCIRGSYYFRVVPESYDEKIIKNVAAMGHEVGYHYEDVDLIWTDKKRNGISEEQLIDEAYESFKKNLRMFKDLVDVKTVCMHGSPLSKYDNKLVWKKYDYKKLGIIGEPYYDLDFNQFAYLTDTGRRWNGSNVSVRDKVSSKYKFNFKTTQDIINNIDKLPAKIMFNFHPERWNDNLLVWSSELITQNLKNIIKRFFYVKR